MFGKPIAKHSAVEDGYCFPNVERLRQIAILGKKMAGDTIARYGTNDVFEICKRVPVKLYYQRWALVTVGECERRSATIRVNLSALDYMEHASLGISRRLLEKSIIAHELCHLLTTSHNESAAQVHEPDSSGFASPSFEEECANNFSAALLEISPAEQERIDQAVRCLRFAIVQENSRRHD